MKTSYNPKLYGCLWPTLFPYGVGLFEDLLCLDTVLGLRHIDMKLHVRHLLNLGDRYFQIHTSFMYVMMNLIQCCTSSFQCKLAFKRSWFPQVSSALGKITEETLKIVEQKFKHSKSFCAEGDDEKAVADLLKYVSYVSDHISGSTPEVSAMWEEMCAIM